MAQHRFLASLLTLISYIGSAVASATCDQLSATSNIDIEYSYSSLEYLGDQAEYWSSACGQLLPSCILVPTSADQVSTIIQTLLTNNEDFAFKSGGHNANQNYSSIADGPLINLKGLNEVIYDSATGTAKVGPGNRWSAVVEALQPLGVTVVGGRIGHVGVGGYIVGGGLSYLSTQYGWAMNSIIAAEVVLANGTIVTASNTTNVDLFNVLRGGGNNFGIVTTYTLQTYPIGQIYGGNLIFASEQTPQVLAAVQNFTENYPDDKAAIIATNEITLATLANIWLIFVFYDGPTPPAGTFDMFTDIGPILNTASTTDYYSFVSAQDDLVITGQVYQITTEMSPLPNVTSQAEVFGSYYDVYTSVVNKHALIPGLIATVAMQPLPKRLATHAIANGGDLLDLDDSVDRMLFEFDFSYDFSSDDTVMDAAISDIFTGMREKVQAFVADGTLEDAYIPLFMNDANYQQDYFGRLRPGKLTYAQEIRSALDPDGFFRDRTGGFKL